MPEFPSRFKKFYYRWAKKLLWPVIQELLINIEKTDSKIDNIRNSLNNLNTTLDHLNTSLNTVSKDLMQSINFVKKEIHLLGLVVEANSPKKVGAEHFRLGAEIYYFSQVDLDKPAERRICLPNLGFTMPEYYGYYSMWPEELEMLSRYAGKGEKYLEIGSLCGIQACFLAKTHPKLTVVCVDAFQEGFATQSGHKHFFEKNVSLHGDGRVELIQGYSSDVLPTRPENAFDTVLIDGDHSYDAVLQDAINSYRITKPGGHILFHDYSYVEETTKAIDHFREHHNGLNIIEQKSSLVAVRVPSEKPVLKKKED